MRASRHFQTLMSTRAKVYVHVYDLSNWNGYLHGAGLGAYHSGVEIGGREYVRSREEKRKESVRERDKRV